MALHRSALSGGLESMKGLSSSTINVTWGVAPATIGGETVNGWRIEYKESGENAMAMYQGDGPQTLDDPSG